jgi:twitching motility protein PilU
MPAGAISSEVKANAGDWGLELKLEEIEVDLPAEDPGRQGI